MEPRSVSVIIPCYNIEGRSRVLQEALFSVLKQTYPCHEIIVVDDGSSDRSCDVIRTAIEAFKNDVTEIRLVSLSENGGTSLARNAGIAEASGELVAFLDFDDLYLPTFVEKAVALLAKERAPQVVLSPAYFYKNYRGLEKVHCESIAPEINDQSFDEFVAYTLRANFPTPMGSSLMMRRSLFHEHPDLRYSEFLSKRTAEDVHFSYKLLVLGIRPYILKEPHVIHRTYFRHMSRSYAAFLRCNELEVFDYMTADVMEPLLAKFEEREPGLHREVSSALARKRGQFVIKSFFLERRYLDSVLYLMKHLDRAKTWLMYLFLSLSQIWPLSEIRTLYGFSRTPTDRDGVVAVRQYLADIEDELPPVTL